MTVGLAVSLTTMGEAAARDEAAVARLVDLSRSLPPEFKSDVLARLAESGTLGLSQAASDVLEEAFFAASGAQERIRLDVATLTGDMTGREEVRSRALANQLDELTCVRAPAARRRRSVVKTPEGVVGDVFVWHGSGASAATFPGDKATLLQVLLEYLPPKRFRAFDDCNNLACDERVRGAGADRPQAEPTLVIL